ncbi:MAG: DUF4870 domain-containing protein [Tepidisphaeraceae bacterium]
MSQATTSAAVSGDQNEATLVYVGGVFTPLVPAILKWGVRPNASDFVKQHINETLNWGITLLAINIALSIAMAVVARFVPALALVGSLVSLAIFVGHLYFTLFKGMPAMKRGESYRYPFAIRLFK